MGIKGLWKILDPFSERKPLYELFGKTVAIDLAGWICESLCVVDYEVQAKFYLRNLFFRTCYLLMSGVNPVFVLEGVAPKLKHDVIAKRNEIQFRGAQPRNRKEPTNGGTLSQKKPSKGRSQFNYVMKQCEELIKSMGLRCVQAPGEAEAFCAHLNAANLVDGIISQDSDCFAYGARRVYRNFTMSMQKSASAIGGAVDVYDLDVVRKSMDFGRNKIIMMALMCGCDYCPEGVGGIGPDAVQKFFALFPDDEVMERVKLWRANDAKYTSLEMRVDDKTICVSCGHYGKEPKHAKGGCDRCKTSSGCDSSLWKQQRLGIKTELQIRKKAMADDEFPSQEIIDEFLQQPIEMSSLQLDWGQPNLIKFLRLMSSMLKWEEIYCFQKFLPLLTRWQLHHLSDHPKSSAFRGCVSPDFIKKKRTPKGIASFEIIWKDEANIFTGLIPGKQMSEYLSAKGSSSEEALQQLWTTIEPVDMVAKAYPELVEHFESLRAKPKSRRKAKETNGECDKPSKKKESRKKKADCSLNDMSGLQLAVDEIASESQNNAKKTMPTKKKRIEKKPEKCRTLEHFFRKESAHSVDVVCSPKIKTAMLNLSDFSFDTEMDENDYSRIIERIVSQPPEISEFGGKKLRFDDNEIDKVSESPPDGKELLPAESDEEWDEFDLIVMGKKSDGSKISSLTETKSSTPILIDKFLSKHFRRTSSPLAAKDVLQTSFFGGGPTDDVDLFERSVDLKNMEDVELSDSDSENECRDKETNSKTSDEMSDGIAYANDTFDDFLGLGKEYVPITSDLRNKWNKK